MSSYGTKFHCLCRWLNKISEGNQWRRRTHVSENVYYGTYSIGKRGGRIGARWSRDLERAGGARNAVRFVRQVNLSSLVRSKAVQENLHM